MKPVACLCRTEGQHYIRDAINVKGNSSVLLKESEKNFIRENRLSAINRPATAPERKMVDDKNGNSFALEESGWVPKFIYKQVIKQFTIVGISVV